MGNDPHKDDLLLNVIEYGEFESNDHVSRVYEFKKLPQYDDIFKRFDLHKIAGGGDTLSKALNIMQWVTNNSVYNGASPLCPTTSDKIIGFSFGKGDKGAINCANKSILLSDALVYIGIFAAPIAAYNIILNPESPNFELWHSHVIVHVFLPETNRWIVLDPSFNTYAVGDEKRPLNIVEITTALRNGKKINTVVNGVGKLSDIGLNCLLICPIDVEIWRGNDYSHRVGTFGWDATYCLLSDKYTERVKKALQEGKLSGNVSKYLKSYLEKEKIYVNEFLAVPSWTI